LPHAGHILFLEDCKRLRDLLVVGVGSDLMLKANKGGNRPILNQEIRLKTLDSFKPVDYCFIDSLSKPEAPLFILSFIFEKLKPDIYVVNEDVFDIKYREKISSKFNVQLVGLKRSCPEEFENISTSKIIQKIQNLS